MSLILCPPVFWVLDLSEIIDQNNVTAREGQFLIAMLYCFWSFSKIKCCIIYKFSLCCCFDHISIMLMVRFLWGSVKETLSWGLQDAILF